MTIETFIRAMPKVELHVHLEGSTRPATLLKLASRHPVAPPDNPVEGLSEWHTFTDFPHFIEIYIAVSNCLRTPNEIELINREFLQGQAAQHILHSEVTYTALTLYKMHGISLEDQLAAINRARVWSADELNTTMTLTFDIAREVGADDGLITANWAIRRIGTSSPNPSRQRTPCTHSRQVLLCANPTHHLTSVQRPLLFGVRRDLMRATGGKCTLPAISSTTLCSSQPTSNFRSKTASDRCSQRLDARNMRKMHTACNPDLAARTTHRTKPAPGPHQSTLRRMCHLFSAGLPPPVL